MLGVGETNVPCSSNPVIPNISKHLFSLKDVLCVLESVADLFNGKEPEEHGGGEQTDRGEERSPLRGALWPESDPDPQFGQHPPAQHGKTAFFLQCTILSNNFNELLTRLELKWTCIFFLCKTNFCRDFVIRKNLMMVVSLHQLRTNRSNQQLVVQVVESPPMLRVQDVCSYLEITPNYLEKDTA